MRPAHGILATLIVLTAALSHVGPVRAQSEWTATGNFQPGATPQPLFAPPSAPPARFPALPPDPYPSKTVLLPLEQELALHGGSHLYAPEGDVAFEHAAAEAAKCQGVPHGTHGGGCGGGPHGGHPSRLRLPEDWQAPQPWTLFADFLGADPIRYWPGKTWFGPAAYQWEPRFVGAGRYDAIAFAFEQNGQRQDGVGHQLLVDLDLQLTGTERFHAQWRPLGEKNTGGSYYQFNRPSGYVDNSTGEPDRVWFEGEVASVFSGWFQNEFVPRDVHVAAGLLPFQLHNFLLMNDDVAGLAISKNNVYAGTLSNLNVQAFYFFDEVDAFPDAGADVLGMNLSIDHRHTFYEVTYAFREHGQDPGRDAHYAAASGTRLCGPVTLSARGLFKIGDGAGSRDGQLYVLESNVTRVFSGGLAGELDIHHGVFYGNAFHASAGWQPISGGNFNRLWSAFAVNPLINIAQGTLNDTTGAAAGVQLFRHHDDASWTPEVAYQSTGGSSVWGVGLTVQKKVNARSFWDVRGVVNGSDNRALRREGLFVSRAWLF